MSAAQGAAPGTLPEAFGDVPRIGMGCWAIGGPLRSGASEAGWAGTDDAASRAALEAAWDAGVRVFDTADVYGAGHSEALLGAFLRGRDGAVVVSKFGHAFDAARREMTGENADPAQARAAVEASLARLGRERIEIVLLHLNDLAPARAEPIFDVLDALRDAGRIGAYGWSTDFPASVDKVAGRDGFAAVEHAANVLLATPAMNAVAARRGTAQIVRSPLAMGLLTGKYAGGARIAPRDVRNFSQGWNDWFTDRAASPHHLARLGAVRDLLTAGGRTLAQGALGWLLAHAPRTIPVPGAKTAAQAQENAAAIALGPLDAQTMDEIETVLARPPEGPPRAR